MNAEHDPFNRLLKAAARAPKQAVQSPSPNWEAALLARWRHPLMEDDFGPMLRLFRRAVLFASLVMTLSAAFNYLQLRSEAANSMPLTNYAASIELLP